MSAWLGLQILLDYCCFCCCSCSCCCCCSCYSCCFCLFCCFSLVLALVFLVAAVAGVFIAAVDAQVPFVGCCCCCHRTNGQAYNILYDSRLHTIPQMVCCCQHKSTITITSKLALRALRHTQTLLEGVFCPFYLMLLDVYHFPDRLTTSPLSASLRKEVGSIHATVVTFAGETQFFPLPPLSWAFGAFGNIGSERKPLIN